jgi:hypothetical protein
MCLLYFRAEVTSPRSVMELWICECVTRCVCAVLLLADHRRDEKSPFQKGLDAPSMFCSCEPYLVFLPFCTDCRWAAGCLRVFARFSQGDRTLIWLLILLLSYWAFARLTFGEFRVPSHVTLGGNAAGHFVLRDIITRIYDINSIFGKKHKYFSFIFLLS